MSKKFFIMLKPDCLRRELVATIIQKFYNKGYKLCNMKMLLPTIELAQQHYEEHKDKDFFPKLVEYVTSDNVIAMSWSGNVMMARKIVGATSPIDATADSIRGKHCNDRSENLIHCSDSLVSAEREIKLWFGDAEWC